MENTDIAFVSLEIVRFSSKYYAGLFSDEFIERFDFDLEKYVANRKSDYLLKEFPSYTELIESFKNDPFGNLEDDDDYDYMVADKLKLYDVFHIRYLLDNDVDVEAFEIYEHFVGNVKFVVIGKMYSYDGLFLTLAPFMGDESDLQIRLTSGKF
jgi:hypothetical protein